MKVLCINKFYHVRGGADRYFFETIAALEKHGHEVIPFSTAHPRNRPSEYARYFASCGGTEDDLKDMGFWRKLRLFVNGIYSFEAKRRLARLLKDVRPDIAHLHNIQYQLTPSILSVLRRFDVPVVQSLHDWHLVCAGAYLYNRGHRCEKCVGHRYYRCLAGRCYRQSFAASLMACLSKYVDAALDLWAGNVDVFGVPGMHMADRLERWGIPKSKFHVIANPMDLRHLRPTFEVGDNVVWYGRLLRLKGVYIILRAARQLPHIRFDLYGSGPEEGGVRSYIERHTLANVALDVKTRWGSDLEGRVSGALCIVEPSEWHHPSQYVLWEALALGKAVLATRIGGTPELVEEECNGALFEPGDWRGLARLIERLSEDHDTANAWGRRGRAKVESRLVDRSFHDRLMELYEAAIERHAR